MKFNPNATLDTSNIRDRRKPRTTQRASGGGRGNGGGGASWLSGDARAPKAKPTVTSLDYRPERDGTPIAKKLPFDATEGGSVAALLALRTALSGTRGATPLGTRQEALSVNPVRNGGGLSPLALYRQALTRTKAASMARPAGNGVASVASGVRGVGAAVGGDTLGRLMGAIRTKESGGNYKARGIATKYGTASGAYQFLDSTWGGYGGYKRASDAPPAVQDARARQVMGDYLNRFGGDPAKVAIAWYAGPGAVGKANMSNRQNGGRMPSIQAYADAVVRLMR